DAGRWTRPARAARGRPARRNRLALLSMVIATGGAQQATLEPDHAQVLAMCRRPASVAEIAARLRLPAVVTKVLLSDLVDCGAVRAAAPRSEADATNRVLLERLLDGLQRRL